jgi:hypothetical protein
VLGSPNRQPFGSPNKIPTAQSMQLDQLLTAALGGEALAAGATEVLPVPTVAGDDGQRDAHVANSRRRFLESLSTCTSFFEHCPTCYNVRSSSRWVSGGPQPCPIASGGAALRPAIQMPDLDQALLLHCK